MRLQIVRAATHLLGLVVAATLLASCSLLVDTAGSPVPSGPPGATAPSPRPDSASPTPTPSVGASGPAPERPGFVHREGRQLMLDGSPYVFTGLNIYNATSYERHGCSYGMGTRASVERSLDEIGPGQEVIRSWFFQFQATEDGRRDWSTFDTVIDVARERGYRVIPVLINQWGDCEGWRKFEDGYKDESWYREGFRTDPTSPGMRATYEEWVREVVTRYRDEPAILSWQLVNEAEALVNYKGSCSRTASQTLAAFAGRMGRLVKAIDPLHLLSLGTIGTGQCGAREAEYFRVHAVPEIDLCEYHDYDDAAAVPGDRWNGLRRRIAQCARLDKPLFVGEVGLFATDAGGTLEGRSRVIERKLKGQMGAGVVGMVAWLWRDGRHGGSSLDGYEVGPDDPVLEALRGV